jgi:lipid-binding SYLF domain-containing protein
VAARGSTNASAAPDASTSLGKAGLGIGGAHGDGCVYEQGKDAGDTKMNQLSIGLQAGAEGFSEIIFFQNKRSFDEFTSGNFELGANVVAVEITAAAEGATPRPGTRRGARSV